MQQLFFELFVAIHGKDEFTGGSDTTASALNQGAAKGLDFPKAPKRRAFGGGATGARNGLYLKFSCQIVRENTGEQIQLVANARAWFKRARVG